MRPTRAEVSLGAIRHNITEIKKLNPNAMMMAVVKANAYGHGAVRVANTALGAGAQWLGVALYEEALELRDAGITAPICVIGAMLAEDCGQCVEIGVSPSLCMEEQVLACQGAAEKSGKKAKVHIKIETGFNRLGVRPEELDALLDVVEQCGLVEIEGMFTHFAGADMEDDSFVFLQYAEFEKAKRIAEGRGYHPLIHVSNSAGTLRYPNLANDLVRCGDIIYGNRPSGDFVSPIALIQAASLKTQVLMAKQVEAGQTIGYGMTYTTEKPSVIATLPIGYDDGYRRIMQGKAQVLINGRRCPVVGRICMDHIMADVSEAGAVAIGTEAVLLGRQGEEEITSDEMAGWQGTINYEVFCGLTARVPRTYVE